MQIAFEHPDQPAVHALIAELDAYLYSIYPAESVYALDIASLCHPEVLFAVVRDPDGTPVGCGAIVVKPDYGEIKRMFVRPQARGRGVARRLLETLEAQAMSSGCRTFLLETGPPASGSARAVRTHGVPAPRPVRGVSGRSALDLHAEGCAMRCGGRRGVSAP